MYSVRLLETRDIPQAMRLKEAAGWNQTEADWERLLALAPDGCFGIELDGVLAATTTVICYGHDLAWIGMVLTRSEYRRRGLARALLEQALDQVAKRGVGCVKLDATDLGRPLYESLGFAAECHIERWLRSPRPFECTPVLDSGAPVDLVLDREAFGADRRALLESLRAVESASVPGGFTMGRPGSSAAYLGPCVAQSIETARNLVSTVVARHAAEPLYWDLLPENSAAVALAGELGFQPSRRLTRMVSGRQGRRFTGQTGMVWAIAGFEFG